MLRSCACPCQSLRLGYARSVRCQTLCKTLHSGLEDFHRLAQSGSEKQATSFERPSKIKAHKKHVINFRFAASISSSFSTRFPILSRMHFQAYQCVGMVSVSLLFLDRFVVRSFIVWTDHHHWQTFALDFSNPILTHDLRPEILDKHVPSTFLLEYHHLGT